MADKLQAHALTQQQVEDTIAKTVCPSCEMHAGYACSGTHGVHVKRAVLFIQSQRAKS